ncbi:YfcE family phosphodiesterase [candidate division LCP-89 bacterium B3_LCP]|uniref:Phosphoesterase n=1 Tax=candidate division LCP-89 bacterium B3_LCP TaxID=2012998 RepID=A0A532V2Q6_UNCL8|nr:MAG: YfcE family phosphodiesterase [candidate division LCP-89 bacterium B3_LCP]
MTRILVLSDTHLIQGGDRSVADPDLLEMLEDYLLKADFIVHAGDHTGIGFYFALEEKGNLTSVCGNMDAPLLRDDLPEQTIITCEGIRIGIIHGWGASKGLEDRVFRKWEGNIPDIIVFGHSHRAHKSWRDQTMLFNPGSPTSPRGPFPTFGWIEVNGSSFDAQIISLSEIN